MTEQEYKEHINAKASKVKTKEELNELLTEITERTPFDYTIIEE